MAERTFTAIFQESDGWIVGYCEELPGAVVQEHTLDEARESMKEVIHELLDANRDVRNDDSGRGGVTEEATKE